MMTDLTIIVPARNEEFLQNTIDDLLANIRGETEIIVILDGYWPDKGLAVHPRLTVVHHPEPIGQRAAVNYGAKLSRAKFIMKLDAHCAVDDGFDVKLMADCEPDWTVIPAMYNLHAFDWQCGRCGRRTYQGPKPEACKKCDNKNKFEKIIVWQPKKNPRSEFYYFDRDLRFAYWREFKKRSEAAGDIADTMSSLGACFFMRRARFWEIDGLDEGHGSWGQVGTELACKSWLSGGRQVTNKKTWFAHMFRTGGGFAFPYPISARQQEAARRYSKELWLRGKWPGAKHDLNWLLEKFRPVPGWHDAAQVKKGMVYYTDNQCEERITNIVRRQLNRLCNGNEMIAVSQYPIDFGSNIVLAQPRGPLTMFRQILTGLEACTAEVVFLAEHDVLYHPSHFDFTPPRKDVFYYNENTWKVDVKTGRALFYYTKQTSGLCAYRELLLEHYRKRVERVADRGFTRRMGFEPGTHKFPRGIDDYTSERWMSAGPNIDLRHANNLTASRFKKEQFRSQRSIKGWTPADEVPGWGMTKGRMDDFLREVADGLYAT